ncbi:glycosyltransferase family 4 protein [Microbacterium sp. X-17]|uniref:glycosyltransferase family 4 protein n=1 Tax=Microbacterium sp. X-17 TaxID=3144404 RepID=UPI0031F5A249
MSGDAPLTVAVVYDCLYPVNTGGGERVYRALAERFAERGAAVDYLTRAQWPPGQAPSVDFAIREIWRGEIADEHGDRMPRAAVGFARATYRALRRSRGSYDIVVVSALPPLNVLAARLALRGTRSWLVADWLEVWSLRKWFEYSGPVVGSVAWLLQVIGLRLSDEVTVNSSFTLRKARRRGRGGLVLGLMDLAGAAAPSVEPETDRDLILFAGRHIADKQLDALPAAMRVVQRSHPGARLVVAGSGPETPALLSAAREAGVEPEVLGRVPDDDLEDLMARASVLVNPSRREGFGLVVAEAASHGTPSVVVAGEDNAAADLVEDGVNGFLSPSVSPAELGGAVVRALDGGDELRASTRRWFAEASATRNLRASVDELLRRYERARTD